MTAVLHLRAANPGPLSLSGTNSYVVGDGPCWVVDPGPDLDDHLDALAAAVAERGGAGGIVVTHDHADHVEGVPALVERLGGVVPVHGARYGDRQVGDGDRVGPFEVLRTPGHAPDHLVYVAGADAFTGDTVLGEGSVFIAPDPGALAGYLDALRRLRGMGLERLWPGHGPRVDDPAAKLDQYVAHRLERERKLVEALDAGTRGDDALLDAVWHDVPAVLRPAAAITLRTHLDKLRDEGRLPDGA